jgi:hypothetical protein
VTHLGVFFVVTFLMGAVASAVGILLLAEFADWRKRRAARSDAALTLAAGGEPLPSVEEIVSLMRETAELWRAVRGV